ncbi:MAG: ABC transporter permease [Rhizobiaceae bacterium]
MTESFPTHYTEATKVEEPSDPLLRDRKFHSIVPRASVSGHALVLVISIMAFLASLTLGAVSLVNDTARGWQSDISREVTIQLRDVEGQDIEAALIKVRQIVGEVSGVTSVSVLDEDAMGRLLEPWLGSGLNLDELPVPRLVTVTINENSPPDLEALRNLVVEAVPGTSLDDHRAWVDRLTTMARATILGGLLVFLLMMAATVLTVIFATRGAMSGNRHVIEVLHFVGAEQSYIASQFQKHFLLLGLKGALIGGLAAIVCFFLIGFWAQSNVADPTTEQAAALFGRFSVGLSGYVGTLILIVIIAVLTALTSRLTVFRHVGTLDKSGGDE